MNHISGVSLTRSVLVSLMLVMAHVVCIQTIALGGDVDYPSNTQYLRIDTGYSVFSPSRYDTLWSKVTGPNEGLSDLPIPSQYAIDRAPPGGIALNVGIGYYFTTAPIRAELSISYVNFKSGTDKTVSLFSMKRNDLRSTITVYYDWLKRDSVLVPFVGATAGVGYTQDRLLFSRANTLPVKTQDPRVTLPFHEAYGENLVYSGTHNQACYIPLDQTFVFNPHGSKIPGIDEQSVLSIDAKSHLNFTYGAVAGISINVSRGIALDMMYRVENAPATRFGEEKLYVSTMSSQWQGDRGETKCEYEDSKFGGWSLYSDMDVKQTLRHTITLGLRVDF